jgi:hypothetical protein
VTRFRVVTVFDISQTEGDPLPEHPCQALSTASERGAWLYGRLLEVARSQGVQVREGMTGLGRAHGVFVPGASTIGLARGLSTDQAAKTLCHDPLTARNTSSAGVAQRRRDYPFGRGTPGARQTRRRLLSENDDGGGCGCENRHQPDGGQRR